MSIIIRLQNLPWSANSVDIRRFFSGLSIPEGGVHIVGGEMGDAFIAFSTDEDARLAMAKDGGKIKDMQIKLLLSSRTEMMRVIEQARQQNMVTAQPHIVVPQQPAILSLQQPARIMTPTSESDRRRGRSQSPHRRSRDRSPTRDRRRSPDERRGPDDRRGSKRDRSRSPRSSRSFSRDSDRRSDRFKRDDKRYDDSRYRDDRRSSRDSSQEPKKYFDADHVNSRSQLHATEGFRNMQPPYEQQTANVGMPGYPFVNQQSSVAKNFSEPYARVSAGSTPQVPPSERIMPNKPMEFPSVSDKKLPLSGAYPQEQMSYGRPSFESSVTSAKELPVSSEQQAQKPRRRTRFEPEFVPSSAASSFTPSDTKTSNDNQRETSYNGVRTLSGSYPQTRETWSQDVSGNSENAPWSDKRQGLLDLPMSKNGDFVQVVPMDLDASPSEMTPEKEIYHETAPIRGPAPYVRNNASPRRDNLNRGPQTHNDNEGSSIHSDRGPVAHSDRRGMMIHGDNQGRVPSSLTVEVKGLPPDARIDHILDLFHGIPLPAANIRIEANDQGFEKAIIRFVSVSDYEEALSRNRRFMHEGRCELVPCPDSAFDSARQQKSKPKPKPREEDLTIQMRGLPFSCKEDDIVTFFDGLGILDLYVDVAPDGRASGSGFVEFGTPEDFRAALAMNGKMIGHRYITISVASKEMMAVSRGEDYNPVNQRVRPHPNTQYPGNNRPNYPPVNQNRPPQMRPPLNNVRPPLNQGRLPPPVNPNRPPPCVSMKNLPEGVTDRNIAEFLGQNSVRPRAVHIMLRPDKTPSGDAFAEFGSPADLDRALELSGKLMLGKRVIVQPISYHEMSEILGRPVPMPLPPAPPALLRTPSDMERPRRPLLSQNPGEVGFRERPRMELPNRGSRPRMETGRPFGLARMRPPWPNRPPFNGGNRPEGRFPGPPSERGVKDFGAPGCVVSINNLHFKAGLEELLNFFQDYEVTKDNILRRFNENNQTTGEARVAFKTPRDAQRAVRELNQKPIMGRPLFLSLL